MRQLLVLVPRGAGERVLDAARSHDGVNLARFVAESPDGPVDAVFVHLSNRQVEGFMREVDALEGARVTLAPHGVLALHPPADEAAAQVRDVTVRSPVEVYLGGLQSVGSWTGFLGYAAAAGAVVWIALVTNTAYLLVGAMLIAPFAGPAMNAAVGTARGDLTLVGRTLGRYFAALALATAVAAALTWAFGPAAPTTLMRDVAAVSRTAVLLPLTAGAAGALHLLQSERSSLVSGAAVGLLVSAALAPPAGVAGAALVMGDGAMFRSGVFLLLLQLVGINLAGAAVFRAFDLTSKGARYPRGERSRSFAVLAASVVALGALLAWQFAPGGALERASVEGEAEAEARAAAEATGVARVLEADARFVAPGSDELLVTLVVRPLADGDVEGAVRRAVGARVAAAFPSVDPLVDVRVVRS